MTRRIVEAIPADVVKRLHALVAVDGMEDDDLVGDSILGGGAAGQPGLADIPGCVRVTLYDTGTLFGMRCNALSCA